ncbi:hypothetical protein MMC07_002944 [Pseudocyphellaria aurata]|nr:hypothetical protein [Pseudocyphellaria aurata]
MGSSSSKASRLAGNTATKRKYPQRVPPPPAAAAAPPPPPPPPTARGTLSSSSTAPPSPATSPTAHANLPASASKTKEIALDGSDPTFAQSLRDLGPVTPSSTYSNSSTVSSRPHPSSPSSPTSPHTQFAANPALQILSARSRLAADADREFARAARAPSGSDDARRRFVDSTILRQILVLRDVHGVPGEEIERRLALQRGVVGRLGPKGVVGGVGNYASPLR